MADRDGLSIELVEGDMADLSHFSDLSFDLIVNPASTMFSEKVLPVWCESFRALDHGGVLVIKGAFADGKPLLAIPNYARLNRGGRSIVWIKEQ